MRLLTLALIMLCMQAICLEKNFLHNPTLAPVTSLTLPNNSRIALVIDGKPNFAIAADFDVEKNTPPERRSVTKAVKVIQEAFRNCTGADIKAYTPNSPQLKDYMVIMTLGDNEITRRMQVDTSLIPRQGFIVRATSKVIVIAGYDGSFVPDSHTLYDWPRIRFNGTLNGAYDFVERVLGVRYYFPGIGTIYPKKKDVAIYAMSYKDRPHFINRFSHTIARAQDKAAFLPEMRADESEDWEGRYRLARGDGFWVGQAPAVELLDKNNPNELDTIHYRDGNGHLYHNARNHMGNYMDTSNLDLVELLLKELHRHYSSAGKDQSVWMNYQANLSHVTFGQCYTLVRGMDTPSIRKLNLIPEELRGSPGQELSNVHARFTFHLARKLNEAYPGRRLIVTPFSNYFLPPTMPEYQRYPDNIDLCITLNDLPAKAADKELISKYRSLMGNYYEMLGRRPIAAVWLFNPNMRHNRWARAVSGRHIGAIAKALAPYLGREELIFDYNGRHEWELFYNYYLVWRCLWNPDFDVEAALAEMWSLLYGNAAPHIEEFYSTVCRQYDKNAQGMALNEAFSNEMLDKLEEMLRDAEKAVDASSPEAKRLALFKRYWNRTFTESRALANFRRPTCEVKRCKAKPNIDGIEDREWANAREIILEDAPFTPSHGKCRSSIRMLHDKDGIYLLLKSQGTPLARKDYTVWNNCSLEFKAKRNLEDNEYCHFAFDAYGQSFSGRDKYEYMLESVTVNRASKCASASDTSDGNWLMECFIPWQEIGASPDNGAYSMMGNIIISRKQPEQCIQSFSLTFGKEDDDLFGTFVMEK